MEKERSIFEDVLSLQDASTHQPEEPGPMINLDTFDETPKMEIIKELCPPPVLAEVHDVTITPQVSHSSNEQTVSLQNDLIPAESPQEVHIVGTPIYSPLLVILLLITSCSGFHENLLPFHFMDILFTILFLPFLGFFFFSYM